MFKLISDTSCDWIKEYAEEHNVTLVPLYTTFDGQTYYKEQFEISYDEFYRKMTDENAFPKSSLLYAVVYQHTSLVHTTQPALQGI